VTANRHSAPNSEPPFPTLRFSTDTFGQRERIEAWRELFGRTICAAEIEPLPDAEFHSDVTLRVLPGLGMASGVCSGARYWRPASLTAHDDLIFIVNHAGNDLANMLGRETIVKSGEAVLVTMEAVGGVINQAATRFTTMRIPRSALLGAVPDLHAAMIKPIPADDPALLMLLNYISVLEDNDAVTTEEQRASVVANLHDLMAVSVGAKGEHLERAKHRGVAAARLRAIKTDIREHLPDGDLVAADLAARHGVTPRYIQLLFDRAGETYSEFVRFERLAAAHRLLRDPSHMSRTIADIAFSVGFNDISYFNRSFRKQFGKTPSDLRAGFG
jgi:AraC-like DNA-binding protein